MHSEFFMKLGYELKQDGKHNRPVFPWILMVIEVGQLQKDDEIDPVKVLYSRCNEASCPSDDSFAGIVPIIAL